MAQGKKAVTGLELKIDQLIHGLRTKLSSRHGLYVNGAAITRGELLKQARKLQRAYKQRRQSGATHEARVREVKRTTDPAARALLAGCKALIPSVVGTTNPVLTEFGMKPKKRSTPRSTRPVTPLSNEGEPDQIPQNDRAAESAGPPRDSFDGVTR